MGGKDSGGGHALVSLKFYILHVNIPSDIERSLIKVH